MSTELIKQKLNSIDYSFSNGTKVGIALMAYDRSDYTARVLDSISKNKISSEVPIFVFIDGGPKSKSSEIIESIKKFSSIKNKFAIVRKGNIGCSANIINAREEMFMDYEFDSVIVLEDDLVIADNYLEHMISASDKLTREYSNIGMIQGWNPSGDNDSKDPNSFEVISDAHLWGYIMKKHVWMEIRDKMLLYRQQFHDHLPKNGDGKKFFETPTNLFNVRKFIRDLVNSRTEQEGEKTIQEDLEPKLLRLSDPSAATGQDAATEACLINKGFVRLFTSRNKSKNIGKIGLHSTPELYEQMGIGKITYSSFDFNSEEFYVNL